MNTGCTLFPRRCRPLLTALILGGLLLTAGCTSAPSSPRLATKGPVPLSGPAVSSPDGRGAAGEDKIAQCNNDLQALKTIDTAGYARYRREMDHLVASGQRYMQVKGKISGDINDILTPRYQFAMANLCWQLRNALSQSLLTEVNIPQERKP